MACPSFGRHNVLRMGSTASHNQGDVSLGQASRSLHSKHEDILSMGGRKMFRKLVFATFTLDQTDGCLTFKEGVPVDGICCLVEGQTSRRQ
jgi:hypothetical protein